MDAFNVYTSRFLEVIDSLKSVTIKYGTIWNHCLKGQCLKLDVAELGFQ